MPPASQTDVGWVPPEVKKRLKEEAKARKAAEAEAAGNGAVNKTEEKAASNGKADENGENA